jgi:CBS domain-containing protein
MLNSSFTTGECMKRLVLRTVLPALLAIVLFSGVVFLYLLPSFSRVVMDQKRLMIRELTESAWNILARFEAEERAGHLSRTEAQQAAIEQVRSLHYGQQSKDYFWINDLHPRMIVHPYRPDLESTDLSDFADPHGKLIFVEMARVVAADGAGYVAYMWQWKDDPARIVPKLSYVKGFAPWGWIIGTGVYTQDVDAEVRTITERLQASALVILAVVSLLLYVLLRTSWQAERGRLRAMGAVRSSEEKYRSLVEAAGESIIMAIRGEGLFANASMLHLAGYDRDEFSRLDIEELVLPTARESETGRRHWQAVMDGLEAPNRYETELQHRDGHLVRVMLTLSRIVLQGRLGFMAVVTRLAKPRELDADAAEHPDDLAAASRRTAVMASLMISHGADPLQVCHLLSANADTVVRRAVELVIEEIGPAPVAFEFMVMGSLGRAEVSLLADQDHAIIYPDVPPNEQPGVQAYFLDLGKRVSEILDASGFPFCLGGIMAGQDACTLPLSGWCERFSAWIRTPDAEELLQAKIFFDFRGLRGEGDLLAALRAHLQAEVAREPRFIHLLARSILQYEPPLGTFGGFVLEEKDAARATFDVKGVLAQIVDYARVRALQHGVAPVNTGERLSALVASGALRPQTAADTQAAFDLLLDLRLRHQARRILDQMAPDNRIEPAALAPESRKQLKQVFTHLKALQAGLDHEFKGG